ncbi:MAG TPA: sigma-70 family RNA polymerase sigma factor [Nocardioides sp.]|nr:sigma-70 family RNA polymerase sigma factor [Nocardioides sp.]
MGVTASLTEDFEAQRPRLRAVAYRMLGSVSEADDALQEAWLRADRADTSDVRNPAGWLTTVVARVCLNLLRTRERRREQPLDDTVHVPDPVISHPDGGDPEHEALLGDSVGLALMVVLERLTPAERLAFVLHDMFAVSFDEIAALIERSPAAARQLASRARRRVQDHAPAPDPDLQKQRVAVDAFFAAARDGDLDALVAVLDPDVVRRADGGAALPIPVLHGPRDVAAQAATIAEFARFGRPVLVNGTAGALAIADGKVFSVMAFSVVHGKIVSIDVLLDPDRVAELDLAVLDA